MRKIFQNKSFRKRSVNWAERFGVALITGAIVWFYFYLATSHVATAFEFNKGPTDYYHYLVEGFMDGDLTMKITPVPELATLVDPYEPLERVRIGHPGLHDASYYKGRYYLYFGVTPALTLFLPFKLATGLHFPEALACALFCVGGYVASLALFFALRRRYFPDTSMGVVWLGTLMLGLGNFCVVMLTRAQFYEVPISSAYFFSCLGFVLLYRVLCERTTQRLWLWLASLAFGLAVGSRPHFVFASVVLGLMLLWLWRENRRARRVGWRLAVVSDVCAAVVPLGFVLAGLFVYNYLRFDSPFNFGQRYQMSGSNQMRMMLFGWECIPANIYYYFLAPAQIGRYFPFFDEIRAYPGTLPKIYYGIENPYGLLSNMPCFWLALIAPIGWLAWHRARRELGLVILTAGVSFGALCGFTLMFVSATNRYMVDFLPSLLMVASIGLLMVGSWPGWRGRGRFAVRAAVTGAIVYTAFFNAMAAFQHNGLFKHHQPADFERIARWFNYPTGWWEKLTGYRHGPVELTVKLSRVSLGTSEPLVVTGTSLRSDFVYLYYTGNDSVQIGFTHMDGSPGFTSAPIPLNYDKPHRIGISMGSLFPPSTHPYFAGWSAAEVHSVKRRLKVTIDGVPFVDREQEFYDASPGFISFGRNHISDYAGREFKGQLMGLLRQPLPEAIMPFTGNGFVRLGLLLPEGKNGQREPLIATGRPSAGDVVFIAYENDEHVRIGLQHGGGESLVSELLPVIPGQTQRLELSMGSFYPDPQTSGERELATAFVATFNDRPILTETATFHPPQKSAPLIGINAGQSEDCAAAFTGRILAVQPIPATTMLVPSSPIVFDQHWLEAGLDPRYGSLRLRLQLPRGRSTSFEPILVTGPSASQADYVWIQYVDGQHIILGYEHTGGGGPRSAVIPIDFDQPHVLEIEMPSLQAPADSPDFGGQSIVSIASIKKRLRIVLDGVVQIQTRGVGHASTPGQVSIGENRISQAFGQRFTGQILKVERGGFSAPSGFLESTGPLEMVLSWPDSPASGVVQTLLATGGTDASDMLFVFYDEQHFARFVVQDAKGNRVSSAPVAIAPGRRHVLRVDWGGFYLPGIKPPAFSSEEWLRRAQTVAVWLNGTRILDGSLDFTAAKPLRVRIGIGAQPAMDFSGTISELRRLPQ